MKDPRVYLVHILECTERIEEFAPDRESFFRETIRQDAVVRNFEVIGEAAKRVPDDFRKKHPDIPWRSFAVFRDILIHQYEGVSLEEVWQVVEKHVPRLKQAIKTALPPLDELEKEIGDGV